METPYDSEKASFFSLVCYGIHSKLNGWIRHEFEKCIGQKPVAFYEYFLATPITKQQAQGKLDSVKAFAPFLFRILNERDFIPKMSSAISAKGWQDISMVNSSFESLREFWTPDGQKGVAAAEVGKMPVMKQLIERWGSGKKETEEGLDGVEFEEDGDSGIVGSTTTLSRDKLVFYMNDALFNLNKKDNDWFPLVQEYSLVVLPWLRCKDQKKFKIYTCSISSSNLFFGEVMIFYPEDDNNDIYVKRKLEKFKDKLKDVVKDLYLPVMTLFENYWEEKQLKDKLKTKIEKLENGTVTLENVFLEKALDKSKEPLELLFYQIWNERKKKLSKEGIGREDYTQVRDSLPFGKYIIASPGLLKEFKRISFIRKTPKKREYLSSFLVNGGQGSGKDCMASITKLLYTEYRFGKQYTINMAALKPGFLSVPLLSGSELVTEHKLKDNCQFNHEIALKGIFKKVWEDFLGSALSDKKTAESKVKDAREHGTLPVVILDELNSLDVDAQGSLLRILQNMKVQSLGSIEEYPDDGWPEMNFLVVGVVNEPEESLTLESTLHRLSEQREIIGSLASSMLYEKLRNMRRLREDLYHRLIRDGKIDLKTLAERREDIPILFSFFVKGELPKEVKWVDLWIDLNAFEALMDIRIPWEGNFRQLQSVAKKVVMKSEQKNREILDEIIKSEEGKKPTTAAVCTSFYRIEADTVEKVLQEDYGIMTKHRSPIID